MLKELKQIIDDNANKDVIFKVTTDSQEYFLTQMFTTHQNVLIGRTSFGTTYIIGYNKIVDVEVLNVLYNI